MTRAGRLSPRAEGAALALAALAARAAFLAAAASATGVAWRDLALRYDGHVYLEIAKTFPRLYVSEQGPYLTTWFPLYPALIRLAGFLTGDLRTAALAVSLAAATAAVLLFRRLAGRFSRRPLLAAGLFVFFPPMWLLTGSLSFVEPVFLCAVLAAVIAAVEDRPGLAAAAGAAAVLSQKSGFLVPGIAVLVAWDRGRFDRRWLAALVVPALAQAALQGYLWRLYGDPLINVKVTRATFGGAFFGVPFSAFLRGIVTPSAFGGAWRRAAIALSGFGYLALTGAAWRRGAAEERPLLIWLGVVLAFYFSLGGFWAFHALPRYLLMAAPAALLLAEPLLPRKERLLLALAPLVLLPYFVGLVEAAQAESLLQRVWGAGYFEAASARLR